MKLILNYLLIGILSYFTSLTASAEVFTYPTIEDDRAGGITFTPMLNALDLDADRNIDVDALIGFGLGYRFSDPYMLEFSYATANAEANVGTDIGDLDLYRLELLLDTGDVGNFSPYIALGAASMEYGNTADDGGAFSAGFGVRYHFSERIALRGDIRYLSAMSETDIDSDLLFGVGLQVFLGETNKATPAPVQQVSSVEPVIVEPVTLSFAERCNAAGGLVDAGGCVKTSVVTEMVTLNVEFSSNSDTVSSTYIPEVGKLAVFMKQYPTITIVIGGHTDSIGSSEYNQSLSQRRVNEVMRILISNYAIDAARLSALGYGETQPLVENNTEVNRAKNRRVEAAISVEVEETLSVDVK